MKRPGDLVKIRAIQNTFSIRSEDFEVKQRLKQSGLQALIERDLPAIEKEVEGLTVERSKLETKVKEFEQKISELSPFTGIPGRPRSVSGIFDSCCFCRVC